MPIKGLSVRSTRTDEIHTQPSAQRRQKRTKGEQTQARLIKAAIAEFSKRGFHGAKISRIVARADVSQPAFYLYFSSKRALYQHLVLKVRDDLLATVRSVRVPAHLDPVAAQRRMRDAIRAFLQYFVDHPSLAALGYFEAETAADIHKEIIAMITSNVASEQAAGYFRTSMDSNFLSECYVGTLDRLINRYLLTGEASADAWPIRLPTSTCLNPGGRSRARLARSDSGWSGAPGTGRQIFITMSGEYRERRGNFLVPGARARR